MCVCVCAYFIAAYIFLFNSWLVCRPVSVSVLGMKLERI